ncbi:MAG: hypothetical protein GY730_10090 [bacterium]|nr:hypothetical protein [bacterium]
MNIIKLYFFIFFLIITPLTLFAEDGFIGDFQKSSSTLTKAINQSNPHISNTEKINRTKYYTTSAKNSYNSTKRVKKLSNLSFQETSIRFQKYNMTSMKFEKNKAFFD